MASAFIKNMNQWASTHPLRTLTWLLDSFSELEALRKQYAYYRDKLLSFRERVA